MFFPDLNLSVEYNGVYYHSSAVRSDDYHYEKYAACRDAGVVLVQIWEDDWNADPLKEIKHVSAFLRDSSDTGTWTLDTLNDENMIARCGETTADVSIEPVNDGVTVYVEPVSGYTGPWNRCVRTSRGHTPTYTCEKTYVNRYSTSTFHVSSPSLTQPR